MIILRKNIKTLRWLVLTLLCVFFINHISSNPNEHISKHIIIAILATQPLLLLNMLLSGVRFKQILQTNKSYVIILKATILAAGLSLITPGRISELLKPTYLYKYANIPLKKSISALFAEKMIDLLLAGLFSYTLLTNAMFPKKIHTLSGGLIFALSFMLIFPSLFPKIFKKVPRLIPVKKLRMLINRFFYEFSQITNLPRLVPIIISSLLTWGSLFLASYLYFSWTVSPQISFITTSSILVLSAVSAVIPIFPAGFGLFEAATIFILTKSGYHTTNVLMISIGYHISQILLTSFFGLIIAFKESSGLLHLIETYRKNLSH